MARSKKAEFGGDFGIRWLVGQRAIRLFSSLSQLHGLHRKSIDRMLAAKQPGAGTRWMPARPFIYKTPIAMAMMVSPGMPNKSDGTQPEARLASLLAQGRPGYNVRPSL